MTVSSRITAVTVYADRAEVTRTASLELEAGTHVLVFDGLPEALDPNSIQVRGGKNAVLKDVKFKKIFFEDQPDADLKSLCDEKDSLEDAIGALGDRVANCLKEQQFIENMAKKLTSPTEKSASFEFDPQKWITMVEFYRTRLDDLGREIRQAEKEKDSLSDRLEKNEREIGLIGARDNKMKNRVEATVLAAEPGEMGLSLVYMVYGPSWSPVYDLRAGSEDKTISIAYHAMIRQSTSEDWDGVDLRLSTARPQISGLQPELSPWRVSLYQPEFLRAAAPASPPAPMSQMFRSQTAGAEAPEEEMMDTAASSVETGATAVFFSINGNSTVKSDNEPHRVTVLVRDFPSSFRYSTVPKLAPYAYLKALAKNDTEYPFLPGPTNVFLDSNFVANAAMELVAPGEEFWTHLGVDEAMKIERAFVSRFEMTEGVFSKTTKLEYKYLLKAKNSKKTEEELVIWDQLPLPENEEIIVELLEPGYKKDTAALKMNESGFLEWFFKVKPGEEIRIPFTFTVEFPKNTKLSGLD